MQYDTTSFHNTSLMTVTTFSTSKPTYLATFLPKNERKFAFVWVLARVLAYVWIRMCMWMQIFPPRTPILAVNSVEHFRETWCEQHVVWEHASAVYFYFPTVSKNNMADARICEVVETPAPHISRSWSMVEIKILCSVCYCLCRMWNDKLF